MAERDLQRRPWRRLVVETATQVLEYLGGTLVIPQTVLVQAYWEEIAAGLQQHDVHVHHLVLHADPGTLIRRITADPVEVGARQWRLDHLAGYERALPWLTHSAELIDTTQHPPAQVAELVLESVRR